MDWKVASQRSQQRWRWEQVSDQPPSSKCRGGSSSRLAGPRVTSSSGKARVPLGPGRLIRSTGPRQLFQILKHDTVTVLHLLCQQLWTTKQWSQDWKRSVFIPIPKKGNAKECSNYCAIALISHASKILLEILQARLQQNVN